MLTKQEWIPHEYQLSALKLMLSQGSVGLFLDPGLGKTSICLSGFKILKQKGYAHKMLIIAPLRPCYAVWPTEIEKWENFKELTYVIVHGPNKEAAIRADADIYIINPEGLVWLLNEQDARYKLQDFDVLCIDESTKFKDSGTKRFKALRPHVKRFKRRWILTGTPAPNGIADLFGQIFILDMGRALGKYVTHFRNEYFYRGYSNYEWILRPGAFREITDRIAPLVYQLNAEDYLKMPELIETNIYIDLPPKAKQVYGDIENSFIAMLDAGDIVAANSAVAGGKCRQIANGAVYLEDGTYTILHEEKLDALEDLLEELSGKPTLVLYEFRHDLERLQRRFPDAQTISSGTPIQTLENIILRFNTGQIPVLLGHPASMGHGLNLQGSCHHVVWFGIPWNYEHYDQAIRRVYRQGQKNEHVYIYHIVARDTKDEDVASVLKLKDKTQAQINEAIARHRAGTLAPVPVKAG
jgi:SNF2 family DNA or RNA helicase